jgi:hypothetical protein
MARKKKAEITMRGGQLLAAGEIIQVMDQGAPIKCRVLSCLGTDDGACLASLEILEGERKGDRVRTTLRAGETSQESK